MRILLVYPEYPKTFWSFSYALKFISRRAANPPLGLVTVAALLPSHWEKRLVDMNVRQLEEKDLLWADYVFIGAMSIQKESVRNVLARCRSAGVKVVAGGPLFTQEYDEFPEVDHFVLNEAEITLPPFLEDLKNGFPRHRYTSEEWADIAATPIPLWELIDLRQYASMNIQYSRGCPYDCEFCNITSLYGRVPRTKESAQVIAELEELYRLGWRGGVFIVDDNFIGNKRKLKTEILPAIAGWMERRRYPFTLSTEASINLADDEELMKMMVDAQFDAVFVGIESPNEESLEECTKIPNRNRDLMASVRKIQAFGMEVQAGFIVGFDKDSSAIFEKMIGFIQESRIATAMVGLLNAPRGTKLYGRLLGENRLVTSTSGDNTDCSMNFIPKMNYERLMSGYRTVIETIYGPAYYYERVRQFLKEYQPVQKRIFRLRWNYLLAGIKSVFVLGIAGKERFYYWGLFFWSLFKRPRLFAKAITFSIYGFHFRKTFEEHFRAVERNMSGCRERVELGKPP